MKILLFSFKMAIKTAGSAQKIRVGRVSGNTAMIFFGLININLRRNMRKPNFRLCENKGADQLCSNCTADQRLCFRYSDSTIPLLPESEILSF